MGGGGRAGVGGEGVGVNVAQPGLILVVTEICTHVYNSQGWAHFFSLSHI